MKEYDNENYLINEIMKQSRHQFIYGYENNIRDNFTKKIIESFPIEMDKDIPMAIYLDDFGLPYIDSENIDKNKIDVISNEYLAFTIASNILNQSKKDIDASVLNERLTRLFHLINIYRNDNYPEIKGLDDLITVFKDSQDFYYNNYLNAIKSGNYNISIDKLAVPFLQISMFIANYKRAIKNDSYFALIFDNKQDIILSSFKSVNLLLSSRINKDISVKVVTEPDKWKTFFDQNGNLVEAIHDYGDVLLDDCYQKYTKRLIKE